MEQSPFFRDFIFKIIIKIKITISVLPSTLLNEFRMMLGLLIIMHDNKDMLFDRMNVNENKFYLLYHCQWQREMNLISPSLTLRMIFASLGLVARWVTQAKERVLRIG